MSIVSGRTVGGGSVSKVGLVVVQCLGQGWWWCFSVLGRGGGGSVSWTGLVVVFQCLGPGWWLCLFSVSGRAG